MTSAPPAAAPRRRVDHVVWVVKPENAKAHVERLEKTLRTTFDFRDGARFGSAFHAWVAWTSGLEIIAPLADGEGLAGDFWHFLETHGEGFWGIVHGVDDLAEACAHAASEGWPVQPLLNNPDGEQRRAGVATWTQTISDLKEAVIGDFLGVRMVLGEIAYREGE